MNFSETCLFCGSSFKTNKPFKKFCTINCNINHHNALKKKLLKEKKCLICNKEFASSREEKIYCSNKCRRKNHNSKRLKAEVKEINCLNCNKIFLPSQIRQIYCSKECAYKYQQIGKLESTIRYCIYCSKEFRPVLGPEKFCSSQCREDREKAIEERKKINKECKNCSKDFSTKKSYQDFCSSECRRVFRLVDLREKTKVKIKKGVVKEPKYRDVDWSSNEIKVLKILSEKGVNSSVIAEALGRTQASVSFRRYKLKIKYEDKTKDVNNIQKNRLNLLNKFKINTAPLETVSSNIIYNKLIVQGFDLFSVTIKNSEIDLLAYKDKKFFKIQLKTAHYLVKSNSFILSSTAFYASKNNKLNFNKYKYPNIDFFIISCMGTDFTYVIPNSLLRNKKITLSFYPERIRERVPDKLFLNTDEYLERYDLIK
jgi:hypothetical protein